MSAGLLDLGGKPLKSKWTHVLTTDLDVAIQAQTGTFDPSKTYTWEFDSGLTITGALTNGNATLTFYEAAVTIDAVSTGTGYGLFIATPRECWALGTVTCVSA